MLEKAITGVDAIKLNETAIGKSGFGFADTTLTKLSAADIAYADVLNLTNAKSTGSGFVIEMDGKKYVITNVHVIEKAKDLEKNIVAYSYDRKEYLLKLVGADRTMMPHMKMSMSRSLADDEYVYTWATMSGTMNGKAVTMSSVDVSKFKDGKAVEHWVYMDPKELMAMMPPPPAPVADTLMK